MQTMSPMSMMQETKSMMGVIRPSCQDSSEVAMVFDIVALNPSRV